MLLTEEQEKCPQCNNKKLRAPKVNDPVYLTTKHALWSGGLEEMLKGNGIPCLRRSTQPIAAAVIMGEIQTTYNFFVPYGAHEKSKELLAGFFDEEE